MKAPSKLDSIATASKAQISEFDYSQVDEVTATTLKFCENSIVYQQKMFIYGIAKNVIIAHDALSKHGYGCFGKWCEHCGISEASAQRLLDVGKLFDSVTVTETEILKTLPATLLYAVARPSAPPELVNAVKAGDITTNAEYQKLLKELENERTARKTAEKKVTGLQASYNTAYKNEEFTIAHAKQLQQEKAETEKQLKGARQALNAAKMRGDKLKTENEELRARPVEVAIDPDEMERRAVARAEELTANLRRQLEKARKTAAADNGENEENRCYDQVIYANRLITSSWGLAKEFYKKLPSGGDGSLKHIAAEMIGRSLEKIKEDLKCL